MQLTVKQLAILHVVQSTALAGLTVALYVIHRIPLDTTVGVLSGLGGFWSAVGGVLKLSGSGIAAPPPAPVTPVPSAPSTAATHVAVVPASHPSPVVAPGAPDALVGSPFGAGLGPEHGAPPA